MNKNKIHQSGNMLFILMVAIALFAGLALAVTNAGKSTSTGKQQKASLIATEIIDYANAVKGAVQKLKYRGCAAEDISFENDDVTGYEHTPPAEDRCKVFHPSGGNVKWKRPDPSWMWNTYTNQPYVFPPDVCIQDVGLSGPDLSHAASYCDNTQEGIELLIYLAGITKNICEAINTNILGTTDIAVDRSNNNSTLMFNGSNWGTGANYEYADDGGIMRGKLAYCFRASSGANNFPNAYVFYMVLWAR